MQGVVGERSALLENLPAPVIDAVLAVAVAAAVMVGGCAEVGTSGSGGSRAAAPPDRESARAPGIDSVRARCEVGARPDYWVPATTPPALLGCARLGVSGKRVEFSGHLARIDGDFHLCIDPAYGEGSQRGSYIPGLCKLTPPPQRFVVRSAQQPRQAVRGYRFVIWGTAPPGMTEVVARFNAGVAHAAVFKVPSNRAPWTFGERPFALFVVEVPLAAACDPVTLVGAGATAAARVARRPAICARSPRPEAGRSRRG